MAKFVVYRDVIGQYRWRLVAGNNEIVAVSEGYTVKSSALRSANRVKQLALLASIVVIAN